VNASKYVDKASTYLSTLCGVKPNRRTGSAGNREATEFFASSILQFGYEVDKTPFQCLDYVYGKSSLATDGNSFEINISPYSLGSDISADLITVSTIEELKSTKCKGKILLISGALCEEQLMPKNFVFYNPQHHQELYALLEDKGPAGIITATMHKPEQIGALYPFPLIVDGDFNIPNVFCTDIVGFEIAEKAGEFFELKIESSRIASIANNVIAHKNPRGGKKIVLTAHIDAYEDTPGASDNASGVVVLMLIAEMLADYQGNRCIEIAALNGEDHYSAGGQMDYLNRYGEEFKDILLAVNVDDVGFMKGKSAFSFYDCSPELQIDAKSCFNDFTGLVEGEQWFNGDHMIFVQNGVSSLAFTAEKMPELMATPPPPARDTPEIIDPSKLVELALALSRLINFL
jgi:aminopeptidase YwaD